MENFSVLMSVYKNDNPIYFSEALESVINQSVIPNEIVLVVDGVISDDLKMVIEEKKKKYKNFVIVDLENNMGQSSALNIGLKKCSNNLVARMDADDISLYERFEKQLEVFKRSPNTVITSAYTLDITTSGEEYGVRKVPLKSKEVLKYFKRRSPVNHGACMYKRDFILKIGGYKKLLQLQDYVLWGDVLKNKGVIENIPEILVKVRVDDKYSRKRTKQYIKEEIEAQKYFYKIGLIDFKDLVINFFVRILVRVLPSKIIFIIYNKILRG